MSLLAHRGAGRRRKQSGLQKIVASVTSFARPRDSRRASRAAGGRGGSGRLAGMPTANLAVAAAAFLLLGAGYVLGSVFPLGGKPAAASGLKVETEQVRGEAGRRGIEPGLVGERNAYAALRPTFLLTAAYDDEPMATEAMRGLQQAGISNARLRMFGPRYGLVVYVDGDRDVDSMRERLRNVPAPDPTFEDFRKRQKDWPLEGKID